MFHRRDLLATAAWLILGEAGAHAGIIAGHLPWTPNAGEPPEAIKLGPWLYFTADEGRAVEALADRIIPPDPETPGGKESGCAVYLDRQLAGPYGRDDGLYTRGPFRTGTENQGPQSQTSRAGLYRKALAALDRYCRARHGGKIFAQLAESDQEKILKDLEEGKAKLEGTDGADFVKQLAKDIQQGWFADPIYGGNKDMVSWKMIGFPGARYNYLDWIERHNERYPLPPVSITGRADWTAKKG